jgi:hypothetical protein
LLLLTTMENLRLSRKNNKRFFESSIRNS